MKSYNEFVNSDKVSLSKIKRDIASACGLNCSTHKAVKMGTHAGFKLGYGNSTTDDGFKVARMTKDSFSVEVHNNNQDIMNKIEQYLTSTGYELSRSASNITVKVN
tara:strand:- start:1221 stop:1538 length:318 start_codon:yes stop_codon:yes gene_type:complete